MRKVARALAASALLAIVAPARAYEPVAPHTPIEAPPAAFYGGLAIGGLLEPFGAGSELDRGCTDLGAASCDTPVPFGGMLLGHVGLLRMPWSVELAFAGSFDYAHPTAHFDGVPHKPFGNPLLSAPPRDESFILVRGGATVLARVRHWWDGPHTRWTLAAGLGVSYKYMALEREVSADGGLEDRPYFSHGTPYVSPAVGLDGSALIRSTPTLAIALGVAIFGETAWGNARSVADPGRLLAGNGNAAPVATPAYRMASGLQAFIVPYVGLAFGP